MFLNRLLKNLWRHFKKHLVAKLLAKFGLKQEHMMRARDVSITQLQDKFDLFE